MEQKELTLQAISKASKTVPESGEMLQDGELGSGFGGSTSGMGKV